MYTAKGGGAGPPLAMSLTTITLTWKYEKLRINRQTYAEILITQKLIQKRKQDSRLYDKKFVASILPHAGRNELRGLYRQ